MKIYWVNSNTKHRLAIVPRPRGGDWLEDDIQAIHREGIDILVSLLTLEEAEELGLLAESSACNKAEIEFRSFPILDRQVPASVPAFMQVVASLRQALGSGKSIGAHCRAGIGRSSLLIASIL